MVLRAVTDAGAHNWPKKSSKWEAMYDTAYTKSGFAKRKVAAVQRQLTTVIGQLKSAVMMYSSKPGGGMHG
jgi:hypothetical protein